MVQRRTITCVSPPPHAARFRRKLGRPKLTVVSKLAADFPLGQSFSAVAAGALCRIPKAMTTPTRDSAVDMVERADAPGTKRAPQPHSLAHDATTCRDQWHNHGATRDKLQIERGRISPHCAQPWEGNVEVKYRTDRLLKHPLTDQFAHVERDRAVILDRAFTFRMPRQTFRQPLACEHALPQRTGLVGRLLLSFALHHVVHCLALNTHIPSTALELVKLGWIILVALEDRFDLRHRRSVSVAIGKAAGCFFGFALNLSDGQHERAFKLVIWVPRDADN